MNDPQLTNVLISIIGSLVVAALGWMMAVQRGYRRDQASLRSEMRTEFSAVNTRIDSGADRADVRADELSRRIDNNGRRIDSGADRADVRADELSRRIDANGRRIDRLASWIAVLVERLTRLEFRVDPHAPPPAFGGLPMPSAEEGPPPDDDRRAL